MTDVEMNSPRIPYRVERAMEAIPQSLDTCLRGGVKPPITAAIVLNAEERVFWVEYHARRKERLCFLLDQLDTIEGWVVEELKHYREREELSAAPVNADE